MRFWIIGAATVAVVVLAIAWILLEHPAYVLGEQYASFDYCDVDEQCILVPAGCCRYPCTYSAINRWSLARYNAEVEQFCRLKVSQRTYSGCSPEIMALPCNASDYEAVCLDHECEVLEHPS